MLPLTVRSKGFEPIAGGTRRSPSTRAWFKRRSFLSATVWISAGNFRLRRPDQINSASGSASS